jgi:hypothetical protein
MAAAAGHGGVLNIEGRGRIAAKMLGLKENAFGRWAADAQIAACIDKDLKCAMRAHDFQSAIDGVALGNAAEVDPERLTKAHTAIGSKLYSASRRQDRASEQGQGSTRRQQVRGQS